MNRWHHAECFSQNREQLEYFTSADNLAGFKTLKKEDQVDCFSLQISSVTNLEHFERDPDPTKSGLGRKRDKDHGLGSDLVSIRDWRKLDRVVMEGEGRKGKVLVCRGLEWDVA